MNWQLVAAGLLFYAAGVGAFTAQQPDDFHCRVTRALAPLLYQGTLVVFLALYHSDPRNGNSVRAANSIRQLVPH